MLSYYYYYLIYSLELSNVHAECQFEVMTYISISKHAGHAGEVLVFYLPIRFFYYLANLIIFTRSSRIPCIFFLEGAFKGIYLREKNFTLSYVVSEI